MLTLLLFPFQFIYRVVRRLGVVDVTRLLHLPQSGCHQENCPDEYVVRTVSQDELTELRRLKLVPRQAGKPKHLADKRRSLVAVFHGDEVVSFLWMAKQAIDGENNYSRSVHLGTSIDMPDGTAFVYNAWTSPKHRGKRLIAVMMCWAVRNRVAGAWACLTMIDWTNTKSIRAFHHVGMRPLGFVIRIGRGPLQISLVPNAARRIGLRVADKAPGVKMAW